MKKITTALISVLIVAGCSLSVFAAETEIITFDDNEPTVCSQHKDNNKNGKCDFCNRTLSDVNNDGNIDIRDLVHLKKIMADIEGVKTADTVQDINCDGCVDSKDLIKLISILLGLEQ